MRKIIHPIAIFLGIISFSIMLFAFAHVASAQTPPVPQNNAPIQYTPLTTGFPAINPAQGEARDFAGYFNYIVKLIIGLTGILAVIMIVWGGIQYVSTDSWFNKSSGRKRIQAAIGGLVLALSSFLILNTIDPSLTYIDFTTSLRKVSLPTAAELSVTRPEGSYETTTGAGAGGDGAIMAPIGNRPVDSNLTQLPNGNYQITPGKLALDNDGRTRPPFHDATWQGQTSCTINGQYLDAGVDRYVVVPVGSSLPCKTRVTITNNTTGISIQAIVGDRGPAYGEISRAAAIAIGSWKEGMGDSILQHNVTYTFHTAQ